MRLSKSKPLLIRLLLISFGAVMLFSCGNKSALFIESREVSDSPNIQSTNDNAQIEQQEVQNKSAEGAEKP